ncbi:MAG: hypothetical protein R3D67_01525 [Hyphomicrobiaceae bacterium]
MMQPVASTRPSNLVVTDALAGTQIALDEEATSASSGKIIHRIVAQRV